MRRHKLQSKPRLNEKPILAKYRGREARRVETVYHRVANEVVKAAKRQGCSAVILEDLKHIRKRIRSTKDLNDRLNR